MAGLVHAVLEHGPTAGSRGTVHLFNPFTLRRRLTEMPPLDVSGLWPVQTEAIRNLEQSLAEARPRSLVQMATGSGKTFMACNQVYRLIRHAGTRRVLFLVDRSNLGRQAYREFQGFTVPGDGRKFTELYNVQLLQSNSIDPVSRVCIATIQRIYSMLRGEELDPEQEEFSGFDVASARHSPQTVEYNPNCPIEEFDFIITDECHRSIYDLWRQVLEYFDAFLIGLTATPSKQTIGFFNQNLVMEYNHQQAVADGINVGYNVYRIETKITEEGSTIEAGMTVDRRDRRTRNVRWEELDEAIPYSPGQLDRDVVAVDQIRHGHPDLPRQGNDRDIPGPRVRAQDHNLRQGRQPRRRHRRRRAGGIRQGQRLLPEDHLPHHWSQARGPDHPVPEQLQSPHCGHRGHDRHRHRHQTSGGGVLHAQRAQPQLLRTDEGARRPHHLQHRLQCGNAGRQKQGAFRHRGRCGRHGKRIVRVLLSGPPPVGALRQAAGDGGHGRPRT